MTRAHLAINPKVAKIITDEVTRRNKELEPGEREHTKKSVAEEFIIKGSKK